MKIVAEDIRSCHSSSKLQRLSDARGPGSVQRTEHVDQKTSREHFALIEECSAIFETIFGAVRRTEKYTPARARLSTIEACVNCSFLDEGPTVQPSNTTSTSVYGVQSLRLSEETTQAPSRSSRSAYFVIDVFLNLQRHRVHLV